MSGDNLTASVEIRQIPELPGYGVSLAGCQATVWCRWGWRKRELSNEWRPLSSRVCRDGHLYVSIRKNKKRFVTGVHRLVLMAFVGPCPEGMEACHGNDRPADNRLSNLRWDTPKNNNKDRIKNGKGIKGSRNGCAKLDEEKVREIRRLLEQGLTHKAIAARFSVAEMQISRVSRKKTWSHVA